MLNELKQLSDIIAASSIKTYSWHPNWNTGGRPAFFLAVNKAGRIESIRLVRDENETSVIRKFSESNTGGSFPGFKVPFLYNDPDSTIKIGDFKDSDAGIRGLFDAIKPLDSEWSKKKVEKSFHRSLVETPKELLKRLGSIPDVFSSIKALAERVGLITTKTLYEDLLQQSKKQILGNLAEKKDWFYFLLCASGKQENQSAYLVFDVSDKQNFEFPVQCEKTRIFINERLLDFDKQSGSELSGKDYYGNKMSVKEKSAVFPKVILPVLGRFSLFSKNKDAESNSRYGMKGPESFLVGRETRQSIKDAFEWIMKKEREGRTWKDVSGSFGYNKAVPVKTVLLAYPTSLPERTPDVAALIGGLSDPQNAESCFEAKSKIVLQWLDGVISSSPDTEVKLFCLAKPDKFNVRTAFSEIVTAKRLLQSIRNWKEGCENIPSIVFNTRSNFGIIAPATPNPTDVARLVNFCWRMDGSHADYVYGVKLGEILRLFLDDKNSYSQNIEKRLVHLIANNSLSLLSEVTRCSTSHKKFECDKDSAKILVSSLRFIPGIIGLCLYRLGIKKEDYMKSAEFMLGQVFNYCDLLHLEYSQRDSEEGKKRNIPSVLIGNESYRQALQNPRRAYSRLADRIAVYKAWADTRGSKLARYALKEMGLLKPKIEELGVPAEVNDNTKIQLVLGYLSRKEAEDKETDK